MQFCCVKDMKYLKQEEQACLLSPTLEDALEETAYPPLERDMDHNAALISSHSLRWILYI